MGGRDGVGQLRGPALDLSRALVCRHETFRRLESRLAQLLGTPPFRRSDRGGRGGLCPRLQLVVAAGREVELMQRLAYVAEPSSKHRRRGRGRHRVLQPGEQPLHPLQSRLDGWAAGRFDGMPGEPPGSGRDGPDDVGMGTGSGRHSGRPIGDRIGDRRGPHAGDRGGVGLVHRDRLAGRDRSRTQSWIVKRNERVA